MASKGKSMADSGYDAEVKSIQAFMSMQVTQDNMNKRLRTQTHKISNNIWNY